MQSARPGAHGWSTRAEHDIGPAQSKDCGGNRQANGELPTELEIKLAVATEGEMTNLKGGLPVVIDRQVIGGIGVGSGTREQDRDIANAALKALPGATTFAF
jgi:glc operon protein GlcG